MSDPIVKGVKRSPSRPSSRQSSPTSSAKSRTTGGKTTRPKPLVKRSTSEKAPARKAAKSNSKSGPAVSAKGKAAKSAPARKPAAAAKPVARKPAAAKASASSRSKAKVPAGKAVTRPAKNSKKPVPAKATKARTAQSKQTKRTVTLPPTPRKHVAPPLPPPRQPTQDESAALRAFERAHKEFVRGRFGEARTQFRALIERYQSVSEVTARARTYLAIADARLRTELTLPRDADSLYDRGVIELNRGEYVAAQEMFERALKREPEAAHIHYGLAATRSRLGSVDTALQALQRALDLQPSLRVRAQHDLDLAPLRNDPEFERMVFAPRF